MTVPKKRKNKMENQTIKIKDVFVIKETADKGFTQWIKVGVGFINQDGSINVILDSVPLNGKLQIRDRKSKQQAA